ncbi:MAG: cation transporter [Clostridia bacterium]|nr:cation transporter [Clostridia bacterium]
MTELLLKIFIKDYKNSSNPVIRKKCGTLASIVGIIINLILSIIKLIIGIITASVAITADALNNLSDAGASVISLVSFKLSAKPADREHPFGHARIEYIASMIVSFIILLVGFELMIDSFKGIFNLKEATPPDFSTVSLIILGISILGKLWLALFYNKIGKKINSGVIKAASTDSLTDCISTAAVLVSSIVVKLTGLEMIDAIVGMGLSMLIIYAGAKILNETKNSILGEAPVEETVDSIKRIVSEEPLVVGIHDMLVHNYGPEKYIASFHAEVDGSNDIFELHDSIDNLEKRISSELNILCTIHLDPIVTDDETVLSLRHFTEDTIHEIYPMISIHDFRTVIGATHTNLIFDIEVPFEIKESSNEIISRIEHQISSKKSECYCVITVDRC